MTELKLDSSRPAVVGVGTSASLAKVRAMLKARTEKADKAAASVKTTNE